METFINLLSLVGSLALFLYGMKIMSEGLEKFAGDRLRNILASMTRNRFMGVCTGILVTALIQSSSATTVMVVSFVNAGLMSLVQSIGVIMGANIGTTVTAWIISAIGFKVNIAAFALPLLGIGLPMVFSGKSKRKSIGEFVFGFSFLFMGLSYLQKSAEALELGNIVANMLAGWAGNGGFFTILLFVFVGAVVTMIVQASAATMAVTLMLFDMQIPGFGFELAAALAMGQNIGTTITAFIASMTANTQARRAAFAHMFFNIFGVVFILLIFHPFCDAVTWFVTNVMGAGNNDLFKLSAFHSAFNICNTLLLIGFVKQIEKFVCWLLPQKESDEEYRLQYISAGILSTAELSILEAQKEIHSYAERCNRMAAFVDELMNTEKDEDFNKLYSRIEKYENITDNMEVEIANYLHKVSDGRLSIESKMEIMRMLRQITELESIGDSCYNLARTLNRHRENSKIPFTEQQLSNMHTMMTMVRKAMSFMQVAVEDVLNGRHVDYNRSYNIENEINNYRRQLKNRNLQDVDAGVYNYQIGVFYIDFISECEKLGDYVLNVVQATTPEKI
ncbi:MAG: Na/Pi cotransporter family protein [Bacteroidaceae bacterium]|nr:Na/Pi cotransporter family protein [Bacteroidaceae bacterium]MBQ5393085.1 Na/Pi cotransporter family protein [Bacteroidaceae bacterium]MBQ5694650.1 Na/Pi cotransporter family protein [Bacteroidaceae bacterium]MBQ5839098.1 Na/Pi cotransporter family protein [Bacteroidaceae bacterium]MBQ5912082.1 Na/Pi cotransporter family protein [Bacteroidaceae bacterium]